jgi:hypothetical protein
MKWWRRSPEFQASWGLSEMPASYQRFPLEDRDVASIPMMAPHLLHHLFKLILEARALCRKLDDLSPQACYALDQFGNIGVLFLAPIIPERSTGTGGRR